MRRTPAAPKDPYIAPDVITPIIDAPTGGWDVISPLARMDPQYAVVLTNWVPRVGYVELRKGYQPSTQGLGTDPIETLMTYRPAGSTEKLFAAGGGKIYDVSSPGSPTTGLTGLGLNRWQYINFTPGTPGAANYLLAVNGTDAPISYDGTVWANPTITGPTPSTFISVNVHQRRIWFVEGSSTSAWYLGVDAISGAATELDLGPLMTLGGKLLSMATWTIDGGFGPNDYAAFISSRGQVILYSGTNPADASAWSLVGVFSMPPIIGTRCFQRSNSEPWLITTHGVIPISQALPFDPSATRSVSVTNRIQNAMLQAAQLYKDNWGWQVITYPKESLAILNIPVQENSSQIQFVMNMLTGAWCKFTGWNANCFEVFNDELYFGDNNGNVNLAYTTSADKVSPILADMQTAFNSFNDPARLKRITMLQPLLLTSGDITPTLGVNVDFESSSPTAPVNSIVPSGAMYDVSTYDFSYYAAGVQVLNNWYAIRPKIGHYFSTIMKVNVAPTGAGGQSIFDSGTFDVMIFDGFTSSDANLQINSFVGVAEVGGVV